MGILLLQFFSEIVVLVTQNKVVVPKRLFKPAKGRGGPKGKKKKTPQRGRKRKHSESSIDSEQWVGDGESEDEYEVEKIIDVRNKKDGSREFLVHWKNWSADYDSWEPEKHLQCADLIDRFFNRAEKLKDGGERELRVVRKHTTRFTLQTPEQGRRLSKRSAQNQRKTYHDEDDSEDDE